VAPRLKPMLIMVDDEQRAHLMALSSSATWDGGKQSQGWWARWLMDHALRALAEQRGLPTAKALAAARARVQRGTPKLAPVGPFDITVEVADPELAARAKPAKR